MLFNLIRKRRPDALAMVMDVSDETVFRRDLDPEYKAHRDPAPEDLHIQADRIAQIVEALGVPVFRLPGFEADDLMATIVEKLRGEDITVYLVSRDKDLDQLLGERVRLFDPVKDEEVDVARMRENKGFGPDQAVEVQTLAGDSTDNVRGVEGVGIKTAAKLIAQYGTAQAVIDHADELSPKLRDRIKAFAPQLPITRQLVTLRRDVPMSFDLAACDIARLNPSAVRPIFAELGFGRINDSLGQLEIFLNSQSHASHGLQPARPGDSSRGRGPADIPLPDRERRAAPTGLANYGLVDTREKLDRLVSDLSAQSEFAFDTETTGLNPVASQLVGISVSWKAAEGYFVPVRAAMGDVLPESLVVEKLKPVFENPEIAKVGQNAKYDMLVLRQLGIRVQGLRFDTLIASFLLDPLARSHSLDWLAKTHFDHDMIPISALIGKGAKQITMDQVDTKRLCEYAAEDADFTWRLRERLAPAMSGSHAEPLFRDTEMPLVDVLVEMENNGVALDVPLLKRLSADLADRLAQLEGQVHEAAGHDFNLDSTRQLAVVLFDELNFPVIKTTKTGRSTDAETLEALAEQTEHPLPKLVLEYRELAKLKGTYVDTLPDMVCPRTGRVHASFHQTGAVTGRLSSSDPNLQNIPIRTDVGKRIREAFIAGAPEHVLVSADYSQIELRLLAHFSQDKALLEAFRSNMDIHRAVAAQVNGIPPEDVTSAQRSAAKAVNFGIIYGQSAFGLSRTLGIPQSDAKAFIDLYFMRYPGIRLFIDRCIQDARKRGYAETILGRRRPIPELQSRNRSLVSFGERIAVNTVVQGSAADLIKRAMIDIHKVLSGSDFSARILVQVHDELVIEVSEKNENSLAAMVREKMENAIPVSVPIVVDIGKGRNWAETK